jgi:hypothetical protein
MTKSSCSGFATARQASTELPAALFVEFGADDVDVLQLLGHVGFSSFGWALDCAVQSKR